MGYGNTCNEMTKYLFLLSFLWFQGCTAQLGEDLTISEYVEGSGYNKAVELYNPTGRTIDLAAVGYVLAIYPNGRTEPGLVVELEGRVEPGGVFVVVDDRADPALRGRADQTASGGFFNGNDAVVLTKGGPGGAVLDAIGQLGYDPGNAWESGGVSTRDVVLRRRASVCVPNSQATSPFDPSVYYNGYPPDDFSGLGEHHADCNAPTLAECASDEYRPVTICPGLLGDVLLDCLEDRYRPDPRRMPDGYGPARDSLYTRIDNHDGAVTDVYTGYTITGVPADPDVARTYVQERDFSAEHTWPQSYGIRNDDPGARSDLHHIFPSYLPVNNARNNYPFGEIDDESETDLWLIEDWTATEPPTENRDAYAELDSREGFAGAGRSLPPNERRFEPREVQKGNTARAVLYVAAIYRDLTSDSASRTFFDAQKDVLREWHERDPVDAAEYRRTCAVAAIQDDKVNPFVLDPTLVNRAFFEE